MTSQRILVSDFDGTITQRDFYQVYAERLMPADAPDYWIEYRAGRMTHFDALRAIFSYTPAGEEGFLGLLGEMRFEPAFREGMTLLEDAGWNVEIVSAGCRWYIDRLLAESGAKVPVHANGGHIDGEGRLIMERPLETPYPSVDVGIDKSAVVQSHLDRGWTVAFAGDGPPDLAPALLVPDHLRFAKGHLAAALGELGKPFHSFDRWIEVARLLSEVTD